MWVQMPTWLVGDGQQPRPAPDGTQRAIYRSNGLWDSPVGVICHRLLPAGDPPRAGDCERGTVRLPVTVRRRRPGMAVLDHRGARIAALGVNGRSDVVELIPEPGTACVVVGTLWVLADHEVSMCADFSEDLTRDWVVRDMEALWTDQYGDKETLSMERIDRGSEAWASSRDRSVDRLVAGCDAPQSDEASHASIGWFSYKAPWPQRHCELWIDLEPAHDREG